MNSFKKLLPALALLLVACTGGTPQTYTLTFNVEDGVQKADLAAASERVVTRRLQSLGQNTTAKLDLTETPSISVKVKEVAALDALTQSLIAPFKLRVMKEAEEGPDTISVEGHGSFAETGLTEADIQWLQASAEPLADGTTVVGDIDPQLTKGRVTIVFTEEGRAKMKTLFEANHRKYIGIFVRDQMVSKLLVDTNVLIDDIIISEIPTLELAQIFADDMNVGLHVTFIPETK